MPSQTIYVKKEFWDKVKKSPSKIINNALKSYFNIKEDKNCLYCGKKLKTNLFMKTFCNAECKNNYHNQKKLKGGKRK